MAGKISKDYKGRGRLNIRFFPLSRRVIKGCNETEIVLPTIQIFTLEGCYREMEHRSAATTVISINRV